tara:strand:+ start:2387 stop:2518 length:132 start_codon:yes stop_codon:yes gene_type:complete
MKKPDILILLTAVFLLGAVVTSVLHDDAGERPQNLMTLENSIR